VPTPGEAMNIMAVAPRHLAPASDAYEAIRSALKSAEGIQVHPERDLALAAMRLNPHPGFAHRADAHEPMRSNTRDAVAAHGGT
jgi:hypothetical protein